MRVVRDRIGILSRGGLEARSEEGLLILTGCMLTVTGLDESGAIGSSSF